MQRAMRSLPSSRRLPSLPWVVLSIDMNLRNFPKRLDSKTSSLRITVPENLDLALEGLIRKVLREQPKMDDIYAFAADYFDMLLKIRDKVGTKFAANQLCPFHNDEDAHEMIKLASVFAKPGIPKAKTPETVKTKYTGTKARRKESSNSTEKSNKTIQKVKQPAATQKKPQRLSGENTDQKLNGTKPERPKTLKLEPKTEDVGDDEEFLKSDAIKVLVEKELMDAAKSGSKDKKKERTDDAEMQQNEISEEGNANEESCLVVDRNNIKSEMQKTDELVVNKANEEKNESEYATKDKKDDIKKEEENKAEEKTEMETQNGKKDVEAITEATYSTKDTAREDIKNELRDHKKGNYEEVLAKTQNDNLEIGTGSDHIQSVESSAAEEDTQKHLVSEPKTEAKSKDDEINKETQKETAEEQETGKGKLFEEKVEDAGKEEETVQAETQDNSKDPSLAGESNLNPDELCAVVDILSIKSLENDKPNTEEVKVAKLEEPKCKKEEGIEEVNIKTEEEKEFLEIQKSVKATEEGNEFTLANKAEEANPHVKITDEPLEMANLAENLKTQTDPVNNKLDMNTTMKEKDIEKTDTDEIKPVPAGDQKSTEGNIKALLDNETRPTSKLIDDDLAQEEKEKKDEPKIITENEGKGVEEQKEKPIEALENKEPEKEKAGKESEIKIENNDIKFAESSEETLQQIGTETKAEEPNQNYRKTEDNEYNLQLEQVSSVKDKQQQPDVKEEQIILAENLRQPEMEKEIHNEGLKPKEETVSTEMEISDERNSYEKPKQKNNIIEAVNKIDTVEKADQTVEALLKESEKEKSLTIQELNKPLDDSEKPETAYTNKVESTDQPETNQTSQQLAGETGNEQSSVVDAQHVIKVEEAEENPPHPEGVQIKTIQTHYYDTLQVPEQVTKEYRIRSVKNSNMVDDLLNINNIILPSDEGQATETATSPLDPTKEEDKELYERDLEDSLMTPSSNYSLNLSEISVQTINEMFLNSEKQYSALDKEERKYVTKTGEKCGDESHMEKREVEEIIHKTIVPSAVGATPIAPRDDAEINEEASIETGLNSEKNQETSLDSYERADTSNEGKSVDSDTPIITVEVKTVIETQTLDDEEKEKEGSGPTEEGESDVQIKIEATIDVPEGMTVDVKEKENKDELRQCANDEPPASETVPKDSQTSSGESESTTSSTATEIKRNDSIKRHFSSTRTLNTTQSLDLDKRNPLLKTRSLSCFRQGVTDFEVWNAIEKELEEAATKIQSNFRGYKTRKKLQRGNAVHITTEESSCSATSVEPEPESKSRVEQQQSTGEFHDSIVLSEHPR